MAYKVYILNSQPAAGASAATLPLLNCAARLADLSAGMQQQRLTGIDVLEFAANPSQLGTQLKALFDDDSVLGAEIPCTLSREAALTCSGLSSLALHSGQATAIVRRGQKEAKLAARDLLAKAFMSALAEAGVNSVRTALILGAGSAARSSLAALHELGCNRFLVGLGNPKRGDELTRQVSHWKRQVHFFPLAEMGDFFLWAREADAYESPAHGTLATDKEHKLRADRDDRQDPRRWELLVNATPVGNPGIEPATLLPDRHFLGCIGRVMDLSGNGTPTLLVHTAQELAMPTIDASAVSRHWASEAVKLWLSEALRRETGEPDEPEHHPQQQQRRFLLKRR